MAKKDDKNKDAEREFAIEGVDPNLEAKIDALMSVEEPEKKPEPEPTKKVEIKVDHQEDQPGSALDSAPAEAPESASAPLLPDDKLPDFSKKDSAKDEKDAAAIEEKPKPAKKKIEVSEAEPEETVEEPKPAEAKLNEEAEETKTKDEAKIDELANAVEPENPDEAEPEPVKVIKPDDSIEPVEQKPKTAKKSPVLIKDEIGIEDRATDAAVEDIIAAESDRMLAIDDAKAELTKKGVKLKNQGLLSRIKSGVADFWANRAARRTVLALLFLTVLAVSLVPSSRYFALNAAGVRASTSFKVVDDKSGQPLKNVEITISGNSAKTDKDGRVKISKVKLGPQQLIAKKPAFAELNQKVTIGLGSNPLGDMKLTAVGSRYVFEAKDYFSDKGVDAEAISGEASARANENGEITLVIEDKELESVDVEIVADNYRTEKLTLPVGSKDIQKIKLVPSRKHAFVSKRSGKYDLYKIDVDGKNEAKVLEGTGREKEEAMVILPHKTKDLIAFVSTRGSQYTKDGFGLSSLNIIDLATNESKEIAVSERIQLIDFIDDRLVFVKIVEGESAASPNRHRLLSYDIEQQQEKELAATNYFNDVLSARGEIYYTPAEYQVNGSVGLFKIKPDGSGKKTVFGEEVWNLFRVSYFKINASIQQTWYEYDLGTTQFNKLGGAPPVLKSRVYVDSPAGINSAWVDDRDGKGVLLLYNTETNDEDRVLSSQSGLRNPIRWLDKDHIVYRVSNNNETADYVLSVSGGEPKKISDVTNIAGLDRWYYY